MTRALPVLRRRRDCTGFTLIEVMIVVLLIGIVAGVAVVNVQGALTTARGDSAAHQLASVLRYGRDASISQRRVIDVVFIQPNRVQLVRQNRPNGTTTIADIVLENNARFEVNLALPDTDDGFGRTTAIDFGSAGSVRFVPDGMLTDSAGVPVNGTIFLGLPNQQLGARAVTVTGTTARSQPYRWTGSRWEAL
jgi:prepilin-type N-terminal cleavage/methylation domain-containing protein